jgi:hypothetical protein
VRCADTRLRGGGLERILLANQFSPFVSRVTCLEGRSGIGWTGLECELFWTGAKLDLGYGEDLADAHLEWNLEELENNNQLESYDGRL